MLHKWRLHCVADVPTADDLAEKLTEHVWTLCSAFRLGPLVFANDSTSPDGAQEYACLIEEHGRWWGIESITFGWCSREEAHRHIEYCLRAAGDPAFRAVQPVPVNPLLEPLDGHRCGCCA